MPPTDDADTALTATGKAYITFVLENPACYRLMSEQEFSVRWHPSHRPAHRAEAARAVLRDIVRSGAEDGSWDVDPGDPLDVTAAVLACWAMVHDLTLLAIDRLAQLESSVDVERLAALAAAASAAGWWPESV